MNKARPFSSLVILMRVLTNRYNLIRRNNCLIPIALHRAAQKRQRISKQNILIKYPNQISKPNIQTKYPKQISKPNIQNKYPNEKSKPNSQNKYPNQISKTNIQTKNPNQISKPNIQPKHLGELSWWFILCMEFLPHSSSAEEIPTLPRASGPRGGGRDSFQSMRRGIPSGLWGGGILPAQGRGKYFLLKVGVNGGLPPV